MEHTQKITPCLWFDSEAEEAIKFYTEAFSDSKILKVIKYGDYIPGNTGKKPGSVMSILFEIQGQEFLALNGGPAFKYSPAVSLFVNCSSEAEVNHLHEVLSAGGEDLMPLGKYPWSDRYAWTTDKYGLSWQINFKPMSQKVTPCLMLVGDNAGRTQEAIKFYESLFEKSSTEYVQHYGPEDNDLEEFVKHASFYLDEFHFYAMDSGGPHQFEFSPAISFIVNCKDQAEVDHFWKGLVTDGTPIHCGWLTDKFGIAWQVVPTVVAEFMGAEDSKKSDRVMETMVQMQKIEIAPLKAAFENA